ncbi:MAG: CBS domain-containing protein [Myxococcota bacterium]
MPKRTTAEQVMRRKLVTLTGDMNVMEAVGLLLKNKISGAPVVTEDGLLEGVLSELDCLNHVIHSVINGVPTGLVADFMTRELITVRADTNLLSIVHLFMTERVRRLPVVDENGRLLGQLSRRDAMQTLYDMMKKQQKSGAAPLYLSAVYDQNEMPARLLGGSSKRPTD